jgi:hypothetical protein
VCGIGRVCASGGAVRGACEIGRTKPFRLKSKELARGGAWASDGGRSRVGEGATRLLAPGEVRSAAKNETGMADFVGAHGVAVGPDGARSFSADQSQSILKVLLSMCLSATPRSAAARQAFPPPRAG